MEMNDLIIASVDDHLIEPPTIFDNHLSAEHRKLAPQYVTDDTGKSFWWWEPEQKKTFNLGVNAVAGRPKEEYGFEPTNITEMRRGTWDPKARVDDMNAAGVLCGLNFPTFVGFAGAWLWDAKDKVNALRVVQAYNDFHIDEWAGPHPGRFIATAILPLWDIDATVQEVKRVVKKGCRSAFFPSNPATTGSTVTGLPSVHNEYWEPLWKLCNEEHVVLNCHIGTGQPADFCSDESPISSWLSSFPMAIATDAAELLHLRALLRYPNLRFSLAEGGIGWVPYLLERTDHVRIHHGPWVRGEWEGRLPSDVFREHFLTCFITDKFGCENYEKVGEDIIAYECDYPHSDSDWPHIPEMLWENVKNLPDRVINKISHENVFRFYGINPCEKLGKENCTVAALRELGKDVDVSIKSYGGNDARVQGDMSKPVTAADVMKTWGGL
jgi:predicted TIM-barrel fold metal-dependent hydrolase